MTSTQAEIDPSQLGTLSVIAWIGDPAGGHNLPYLLAYTLGDGPQGEEGSEAAARRLLEGLGLPIGDRVYEGVGNAKCPVQIVLVDGNQLTLTLPGLSAKCSAPDEWVAAAKDGGQAYFLFATRAWPQAVPGRPVDEEMLKEFAGDEAVLTSSAHCIVSVGQLNK